ncbi:glycosyltransferase [Tripterygium wilfordii]|uniref:Glycosyltransferase n=1 Tax=Tripterygium wilfordii TaxID=458696 RepID=A0A7J7D8M4_TRIWF|nr:probable glycosyltransferase At3g07620 [Tripterygium wilfordii]KAF5742697.1 glycosyltransferase [Tripterygium wilfordii]
MGSICFSLALCLTLFTSISLTKSANDFTSPYLSPTIFSPNYQKMLKNFKIFIYTPQNPFSSNSSVESLFYNSLQNSPFVTQDPNEAHLFFVAFQFEHSARAIARVIRDLRMEFPYWNRTLGADHFYVSCAGIGYESDRNLVELKKNSVQLSCFPATADKFIPHKDITLPPLANSQSHDPQHTPRIDNASARHLGYVRNGAIKESTLVEELRNDPDFVVDSQPSDWRSYVDRLSRSDFCLFEYGADTLGIGEAMRFGCVPVVITDRSIQDLPLMDVLRWQDMAVFVGSGRGVKQVKGVLDGTCEGRRRLGVTASQHFVWNETPQPYDAFHMVMYQLWLRRHTIRYARREMD